MIGKLFIDGVDAYTTYGISVLDYAGVVGWASLKEPERNDWPEEDGVEVDLSEQYLDSREFTISFYSESDAKCSFFFEKIAEQAYHIFNFASIGLQLNLRFLSQSDRESIDGAVFFKMHFADDFPLDGYVYSAPIPVGQESFGFEIDDIDLSNYGAVILEGSMDEIRKCPLVKSNLLTNLKGEKGAIYDGEYVFFKEKDVRLSLLITAPSKEQFWHNYKALLYDLTRSGERVFYDDNVVEEFPCHYKSSDVESFIVDGEGVWCKFSITLVFTSFRIKGEEVLLASEEGEIIVTEDEQEAIDLGE